MTSVAGATLSPWTGRCGMGRERVVINVDDRAEQAAKGLPPRGDSSAREDAVALASVKPYANPKPRIAASA